MDLLIFPSLREGLPNVVLEAQMCKIPVAAYRATGTVDAVADYVGGRLVDVHDTQGLVKVIQDFISDPSLLEQFGARGKEWVSQHFDQRAIWKELIYYYRVWLEES
jgi:glycosyltransferase involved in cell wall biosynthesis